MKTPLFTPSRWHASERGSAVLVLLVFLSIMLLFVADNNYNANWLRRQVKLVEKRQVERLSATMTNRPPASVTLTNPLPARGH
jgi:hypothetical protein